MKFYIRSGKGAEIDAITPLILKIALYYKALDLTFHI